VPGSAAEEEKRGGDNYDLLIEDLLGVRLSEIMGRGC
jgi:hypothetical protein